MTLRMCIVVLVLIPVGTACARPTAPPEHSADVSSAPVGFVNKVWSARESSNVAPGTMYVFLSDGTLVITSSTGTPSLGKWTLVDGTFTMIEDGVPHKTDILSLTPSELTIRSHNPGAAVDLTLVLAPTPAL